MIGEELFNGRTVLFQLLFQGQQCFDQADGQPAFGIANELLASSCLSR
jgi:hypothetical protein